MNPTYGGPCQGLRNAIPEFFKLGFYSEVASLDELDAPYLKNDSFPIHAIGAFKGSWYYNYKLIAWLRNNISRYDGVVIHGLWLFHGYAVYKIITELKRAGKKYPLYFVMPHGMLDPYFQNAESRRLKAIRNYIYWDLIQGKIINNAAGVLFTCEEELILAKNTFKPYRPKLELNVGYGIPEPPPKPIYSSYIKESFDLIIPNKSYILFLSRINYKKGVDLLISAYSDLVLSNLDFDFPNLVIAGPGTNDDYGKKFIETVNSAPHLKERITFPGMLIGDAKWKAFYECDAFILPSHQENFGIAVVEALACGKPVLITNKVNIWREIESQNAGIVENDTIEGTKALLSKWIFSSDEKKNEMKDYALSCYAKSFRVDSAAAKMVNTLTQIINS